MSKWYKFGAIYFCLIMYLFWNMNMVKAEGLRAMDIDIRELLTNLALQGNINLILSDEVKGQVSANLHDMSAEQMLENIAEINGFTYEKNADIIYIYRSANRVSLHNVVLHYLDLSKGAQMIELLLGDKQGINVDKEKALSHVIIDESSNSLSFYADEQQYEKVKNFLHKYDVVPKQVLLEAKVTAIQKDQEKNLGVLWDWSKIPQSPEHEVEYQMVKHSIVNDDGSKQEITDYIPVDKVKRTWKNGEGLPGIIRFGKGADGYPYELYFSAKLEALINEGKANILARPNITTIQGQEAIINIGSEVPVPTVSTTNATTTTSIKYREAGIILKCTPRVNEDGIITVKVHTEVSSPLYVEDMKAYRFQKRSADTSVRLHDGQTMVIGGLIGSDEAKQWSKVPFLSEIPLLGNLFKHVQKSRSETEVLIFLTAKEVKD